METISGGVLLHNRHQYGTWSNLGDPARLEASRLLHLLEGQERLAEIELLLVGATSAASDEVMETFPGWLVETDTGVANIRLTGEDRLECDKCSLGLCHHIAAVRLWVAKNPARLSLLVTQRGWVDLTPDWDEVITRFAGLSLRQRSMVSRWIQFGELTTLRKVLKGMRYCLSGQVTLVQGSRYRVEHDSGNPWLVDLMKPADGCPCDRRQGQGVYNGNAGLCAHQVGAALAAADRSGLHSLV